MDLDNTIRDRALCRRAVLLALEGSQSVYKQFDLRDLHRSPLHLLPTSCNSQVWLRLAKRSARACASR